MIEKLALIPGKSALLTDARLELDGTDIGSAVNTITIKQTVGQLANVTLDLVVFVEPVELANPKITVPEQTAKALDTLGWLSPDKAADLTQWREAATYLRGPQECLDRECEEYFTEEGDEREALEMCSHVQVVTLTPDQVSKVILDASLPQADEPAEATR